ncbi:hypothetical protein J4N45_10165 [Vibrio sp. SCSIO 43140]|uniref:hypothetical protein n=1 Tax=Vibrio sp. SCSIO 43140 TaxID=2819100 RepID=UPI0020762938|nr:hypothetical protein [Vibrio sp. SCSIO 43140]USD58894.1 hypothetical protein J4N45_10165 [Vibrio sp. SCSIO 43140]
MNRSDWATFFSREESFFDFVTSNCTELGCFGLNAYPKYTPGFNMAGKVVVSKPQHVRYICHVNGNQALFDKIKSKAAECYDLYDLLSLNDKRCSRQPIFLEDATRIAVHVDKAHSSQLITHKPTVAIVRERKFEDADKQLDLLQSQVQTLKQLGLESAQVNVAVTTMAIHVDSLELVAYFGREDVVFRRPTGYHYRCRVFWEREVKPSKLGFFISRDPIDYHEVSAPRLSRKDSYENSGIKLEFGAPCDGVFWVAQHTRITPQDD